MCLRQAILTKQFLQCKFALLSDFDLRVVISGTTEKVQK